MKLSCFEMFVFLKTENSERILMYDHFELTNEIYTKMKAILNKSYFEQSY